MGISQKPWVNFLGFQLYWWLCILLQNQALVICAALLGAHLYFHNSPLQELKSLIFLGLMGFSIDFILALFDWYQFNQTPGCMPPAWLLFLWLGFATNVTTLSNLINSHWIILAFTGAAFAPLSYLAAAKLGAVTLPFGYFSTWTLLVAIWFVLLPALFYSQYKLEDISLES